MAGIKTLFNTGSPSARYLIKIFFGLVFLIGQHRAYCLPRNIALNPKNIFEQIKNIPQKERVSAATYIYKANLRKATPAFAMACLDQLSALARNLNDKYLECSVFEMRADYYSVNLGYNDLSTAYYQKAIDFAKSNSLIFETGYYQHRMGLYYSNFKYNASACRYFLSSQEIFNQIGYDKIPDISDYLSQVADFYYFLGDYENAKINLEAALHHLVENGRSKVNIINTIGLIYRNYRQFPQAMIYFNMALNMAVATKDTVWTGIAKGNIGSVYFLQGKYQKALPYIETDYNISTKYGELRNGTIALLRLIKINIDSKNFDKASQQLKSVAFFLDNAKNDVLSLLADYYDLKSQLYEQMGLSTESIAYRKKFELDKDSLIKRNNIAAVERVKLRYEIDKHNAQVNKLKTDAKIQSGEIKAAIAVSALLIIISLLVYNNQRIKSKKDKELLIAEKRIVDEELKNAEVALYHFTENLRQKNILIEDFKKEIDFLKLQSVNNTDAGHLEKLLQAHIMTDENWHEFRKLFSKVYPGFFVNLSRNHPFLSATDIRMLTLIKLGLNNSEMANMLGITIEGIQKGKQRLRKKIDINTIIGIEHDLTAQ